jgi:hypothetical protein
VKVDPTPDVSSKYGAPMGRASHNAYTVTDDARPMYLTRVRLNGGGYDRGGAYWGIGEGLYYYEANPTGLINGFVRGRTREHAKAEVRKIHPHARFYR